MVWLLFPQFLIAILQPEIIDSRVIKSFKKVDATYTAATGYSCTIKLVDNNNNYYILKQIRFESVTVKFSLLVDWLVSSLACELGIPINHVSLIPITTQSDLKMYHERLATLHTCMPGTQLNKDLPSFLPQNFQIYQQPTHGLTQTIIENMTLHEGLPAIIAFDTYIGNGDRSRTNTFYDEQSNHFYGIDQAEAFKYPLAERAHAQLQNLIKIKYFKTCDKKVFAGLRIYRDTLQLLWQQNIPDYMKSLLQKYAQEFFNTCSPAEYQKIMDQIDLYAEIIDKNHKETGLLIVTINNILIEYYRKKPKRKIWSSKKY